MCLAGRHTERLVIPHQIRKGRLQANREQFFRHIRKNQVSRFRSLPALLSLRCYSRCPHFVWEFLREPPGHFNGWRPLVTCPPLVVHFSFIPGDASPMKLVTASGTGFTFCGFLRITLLSSFLLSLANSTLAQTGASKKLVWHPLEFAIVRFNDAAPNSWNIYHSEKKGVLLVRLWKRYLLVNVSDEEVYDIDPERIKVVGDSVEWSYADIPEKPIETPDWKERNLGPVERVRFRLGKDGHYLELQIPLGPNGRPIY
jgi:hypothetical protein